MLASPAWSEPHAQAKYELAQLIKFYSPQAMSPSVAVLTQAVYGTVEASTLLKIEAQADTMLSQWHRESEFNPKATGLPHEDSSGITQTRISNTAMWREFWKKRGVTLGPFKEIRTQVFFGVAEFYWKLGDAKGDVKDAVRRYNGGLKGYPSMGRAVRYADRVMISRKVIFNRPYVKGEKQKRN